MDSSFSMDKARIHCQTREKDLAKKCKRPPFASIEQAANNYQCLCNEIYKRIRSLTGTTERPVR